MEQAPCTAGQVVAAYWPHSDEFDSRPLISRLLDDGVIVALPCIAEGTLCLRFARWTGREILRPGRFGIFEPVQSVTEWLVPNLVVMPLLAFDHKGNRLGYGGGYYDATLAALNTRHRVVAIGLAYEEQAATEELPVEPHDVGLDWVVTPKRAIHFLHPHKP